MTHVPIPPWNSAGVLPPIGVDPTSRDRSPYRVSLADFVLRFGDTPERKQVLAGLLRYRAALHAAGLVSGFQWLDGSFLENVELLEQRAPNDIDVVSFFHLPPGQSQTDLLAKHADLLLLDPANHERIKKEYRVDGYLVPLWLKPELFAQQCTYWYSMWSHRRNGAWKGYLQIDLAPHEDADALAILNADGNEP